MSDLISKADAIEAVKKICWNCSNTICHNLINELSTLPSAEAETVDCTDFIRWLTETVMDDGMWELNAVAYGEVIARKLTKLGVLEVKDGYYIRHVENNTKESDLVYRPSAEAADVYKAHEKEHEEEHLKIVNRIKELQYAIAKTQTIVGKVIESAEAEWIPCSVRLPNMGEMVLITQNCKGKTVEAAYLTSDGPNDLYWSTGLFKSRETDEVLAWMPLPEPYEEVER